MPLPYATEILNLPDMLSYNAALGASSASASCAPGTTSFTKVSF
jgi:hypothetical protein